ncbi:MAG: hypothetical protein OJF50_000925 [Nitrospira sp.]|jgi:predicted DNA-binding transcriptional regulator AlpA|nr:hypothetical protein [Nitrospira sp.]
MNRKHLVSGNVQRETLVSVKEAAKVVGMGAGSLYRLCKIGAVRSFKAGPKLSGVRVSIPELMEDLRRPAK